MRRKVFVLSFLAVFALSLAGCASMGTVKQKDREIQGLRNQVSALESQVQSKDQEINGLKDALSARQPEQEKLEAVPAVKGKTPAKVKAHPSVKDIQTALANAGFAPGRIDGHMGKQTRDALKAFQKTHNLKVNGKANKKTWSLLSEYLNQKTK
ncbi:MAG: peptidoglycan-binding protein [Candidatus Omnitrophota bacterium]